MKMKVISLSGVIPLGIPWAIALLSSGGAMFPSAVSGASPAGPTASISDTQRVAAFLASAPENGGVATIPPGDYLLDGTAPLPIPSGVTVRAYGARFSFPQQLAEGAQLVLFEGTNVTNFAWYGGEFIGHVFDPAKQINAWEPSASTRVFVINTSSNGVTKNILFDQVRSNGISGAVVTVQPTCSNLADVTAYAQGIQVRNCTLLRSGKFMWDYGYLWQEIVWPDEYQPWEVERAISYFPNNLVRPATIAAGDDRVQCNNLNPAIAVSSSNTPTYAVCFYGGPLPPELMLGREYFVVESATNYIKVSGTFGGPAIAFTGTGSYKVNLLDNLQEAYYNLAQPLGAGPGSGAIDITAAQDVEVTHCDLGGLGDLTHFVATKALLFAYNRILGARMGAVWLTNNCQNATVTGNMVDGADGSRVLTVELSQNVTVSYNTFRDGGRGSWIVQPDNIILLGNVFENNTLKGAPNWQRGRRSFLTGNWESSPELYFTLPASGGAYGPVSLVLNHFVIDEYCAASAVTFAPDCQGITMIDNKFSGRSAGIYVAPSSQSVNIQDNVGVAP